MEMNSRICPRLALVVPVFNEEEVLPLTSDIFLSELKSLIQEKRVASDSYILFVDDGSIDKSWDIIVNLNKGCSLFRGIQLSRNRGHQYALLAGLHEVTDKCDVCVSIDCDGQDDIHAMEEMLTEYANGSEIVYGVRNDRSTDSWMKRSSAQTYYRFLKKMGGEDLVIYNHADYRLVSNVVLQEFTNYHEVNLYLRGIFPLMGYPSSIVYYRREKRLSGQSKYSLWKMVSLAMNGITNLSVKPLRWITMMGMVIAAISFVGIIITIIQAIAGITVAGWASIICAVCFLSGVQLISSGIIGEYVGKIYLETKHRPRYIISNRTEEEPK